MLKSSQALAEHHFSEQDGVGFVARCNLTEYTMLDLVHSLRNFDPDDDTLKNILLSLRCCDQTYFQNPDWYDPIKNEDIWNVYSKLGASLAVALVKAVQLVDTMTKAGVIGVLTLDNQDLRGQFYDFGDFMVVPPGCGMAIVSSYLSYLMPVLSMTDALASERVSLGEDSTFDEIAEFDYSEYKLKLFNKYFKYWPRPYHPNCVDCTTDECIINCVAFNVLFSTLLPPHIFGPLVKPGHVDGVPIPICCGYNSAELGIIYNTDDNLTLTSSDFVTLFKLISTAPLTVAGAVPSADSRTKCRSLAALRCGFNYTAIKSAYFNVDFYNFLKDEGFFTEGSELQLKHFYFQPEVDSQVVDFDYYRYNRPIMCDVLQMIFVYNVTQRFFACYEGGCLSPDEVVLGAPKKSPGYPLTRVGRSGDFYEAMTSEEQEQLFRYAKCNVVPTITQLNTKFALSAKNRARTVGGVALASTMINRQYHQKLLKEMSAARGATVVIGTTKFYGGWNFMLKTVAKQVNNPVLMGWDYPKCDRCMPNCLRLYAALLLGSKHEQCCTRSERFYHLANENAQVVTEYILAQGVLFAKPGGTTSGDATTAYANSVFNIFQAITANVDTLMAVDSNTCSDAEVVALQRQVYSAMYRGEPTAPASQSLYEHMQKRFRLMILSDDGVVCADSDYLQKGYVANINRFRATLYYNNGVYMAPDKCWFEPCIDNGPHEFCSQHTLKCDGEFLPYPDPARVLSAGVFVDNYDKTDNIASLERFVALAIDAWPLTKHSDPHYQKVFYALLKWINKMRAEMQEDMLLYFALEYIGDSSTAYWEEDFYKDMYIGTLQSSGGCLVCGTLTAIRCVVCVIKPLLCTRCAYEHAVGTPHREFSSITPYRCAASGCDVSNVLLLHVGGNGIYCTDHKPLLAFPVCANGEMFGINRGNSPGSPDIETFNILSTVKWDHVNDYILANTVEGGLARYAAQTLRVVEEAQKVDYAKAIVVAVLSPNEVAVEWEDRQLPPMGRSVAFSAYTPKSMGYVGEYYLTPLGGESYSLVTTSPYKMAVGTTFVVSQHQVLQLRSPILLPQMTTPTASLVCPKEFQQHSAAYELIATQRLTTVQGPPGTGKSTFAIALGLSFGPRVVYTAVSHAAVDALAQKAAEYLPHDQCTRIAPKNCHIPIFDKFSFNKRGASYIFSTVQSLPEVVADIVVFDEVSMATNYDLALLNDRVSYTRIVFVGDPCQLPAPRTLLAGVLEPEHYNKVTARMCTLGTDVFLDKCYRCPKEIVDTVSQMVYRGKLKSVKPPSGKCFKVFFPGKPTCLGKSMANKDQIAFATKFCEKYGWKDAVFISPYNAQNNLARLSGLNVYTVDSAQGSEFDYVIFSQTSSSPHTTCLSRLNVALTRARCGILCIMSDRKQFSKLKFTEIDTTLQCGLFKVCGNQPAFPPQYANTYKALSAQCQLPDGLAREGRSDVDIEQLISLIGFNFSNQPVTQHTLFATEDFVRANVLGWIGFDIEAVHSTHAQLGTSVPYQLGFSNGSSFIVKPEGLVVSKDQVQFKPINYRFPKGAQFEHLKTHRRSAQPWTSVRPRIVAMLCNYFRPRHAEPIFVVYASTLELMCLRYFVKLGPSQYCHCGKRAYCYSTSGNGYYCFTHGHGCDYLYNIYVYDVAQRYSGSLSANHDAYCTAHKGAHNAADDALMTVCLTSHTHFSEVRWDVQVPTSAHNELINTANRVVQSHMVRAVVDALQPVKIHDMGNPKGIKCIDTVIPWVCYDRAPIDPTVIRFDYTGQEFDGLMVFWNCNVPVYPRNAMGVRFEPRYSTNCVPAWCDGVLYVNKHVFYTPPVTGSTYQNVIPMPFFYYDPEPCQDTVKVPLKAQTCYVRCNTGSSVCTYHYDRYHTFLRFYNSLRLEGFRLFAPADFKPCVLIRKLGLPLEEPKEAPIEVQARFGAPGTVMPALYRDADVPPFKLEVPNYHAKPVLPEGVSINVIKFTQVLQFLTASGVALTSKPSVLHLGAASAHGTSPSTAVLREWLPEGARVVANDIRPFCADAQVVLGPCQTARVEGTYDLIISDVYDEAIKVNLPSSAMASVVTVIEQNLAPGGSAVIKFTANSWDPCMYHFASKCGSWEIFVTAVNAYSSEAFLCCFGYTGEVVCGIDPQRIHTAYNYWRTMTVLNQSYLSTMGGLKPNTRTVPTGPISMRNSELVKDLVKAGRLILK